MHYKSIYVRDFGIFNNQKLENLSSDIVVIGGKNRAGKSSFFNVLRYLPFSLPQDDSIPPALKKYYIEAELKREGEEPYRLILDGYSKTEAVDSSGNRLDASHLFGELDQLSYQQLFTISLDELQRLNSLTKNKKEQKRIYSILLGAGLSELTKIPEIADKYFNKAKNIGGKLGNPEVSSFKSYTLQIKKAEKKRDEALKEISYFNRQRQKLKKTKKEIKDLDTQIYNLERREFLLDLLKNNYQKLENIEELELKYKNRERSAVSEFEPELLRKAENLKKELQIKKQEVEEEKNSLLNIVSDNNFKDFADKLVNKRNELNTYFNKKELLQERINNLIGEQKEIKRALNELKSELKSLNLKWENPLAKLANIKIDFINQKKLSAEINEYKDLKSRKNKIENELEELKLELSLKENKLDELDFISSDKIIKRAAGTLGIAGISAAAAFFYDQNLIFFLILAAGAAVSVYFLGSYKNSRLKSQSKAEIESEISVLNKKIKSSDKNYQQLKKNLNEQKKSLDNYADRLSLEEDNYLSFLNDYYREIKDKKRRLSRLELKEKEADRREEELFKEINKMYKLLKDIYSIFDEKKLAEIDDFELNNLNSYKEKLFNMLDQLHQYSEIAAAFKQKKSSLESLKTEIAQFLGDFRKEKNIEKRLNNYLEELNKAEEFEKINKKLKEQRSQLAYSLNSSDKSKKYLREIKNNFELKNFKENPEQSEAELIFRAIYKEYSSAAAVKKEHKSVETNLEDLIQKKKNLNREITTLNNEIEKLSTSDKIEKAQKEINQARSELKKLAERYAVNKSVYFILKKLRSRMIKKAEDELLKPAADILAEITDNEYQKIEAAANLEEAEFKTADSEAGSLKNTSALSRGSLEQLFLAVRISRIKEIKPPLPVVLDDSFVNFDRSHLYNTAEIISRLASKNQIFILSCHPHLINLISQLNSSAQYWKLEKGKFELSEAEALKNYLS